MTDFENGEPLPVDGEAEYEKGVVIDARGYFVWALQWPKGSPRPKLNTKGTLPSKRLSWLTVPEALVDPPENGKWDADNLVWLTPDTPAYQVLQRQDKPDLWTLQGSMNVWPDNLPELPAGRKWIFTSPPVSRNKRPVWSDSAAEWKLPVARMILNADGSCVNLVAVLDENDIPVPTGGRAVDPAMFTVTDELDNERPLTKGDMLNMDDSVARPKPPRYTKFPVSVLRKVLDNTNNLATFRTFMQDKGYTLEDFESIKMVSLNNKLLREFVVAQGYTMKQAYNALQKAAEVLAKQEKQLVKDLNENE